MINAWRGCATPRARGRQVCPSGGAASGGRSSRLSTLSAAMGPQKKQFVSNKLPQNSTTEVPNVGGDAELQDNRLFRNESSARRSRTRLWRNNSSSSNVTCRVRLSAFSWCRTEFGASHQPFFLLFGRSSGESNGRANGIETSQEHSHEFELEVRQVGITVSSNCLLFAACAGVAKLVVTFCTSISGPRKLRK